MNKWERIQFVRQLGLNTEESVLIGSADWKPEAKKFIEDNEIFSLRTFNDNDYSCHPHYPVIDKQKLYNELALLVSAGYKCIVAKCINPKYAELAGCGYKKGQSVTLEVAYGPVTVRRVTHDGIVDKSFTTGIACSHSSGDSRLDVIAQAIKRADVDDCIFEFSWYAERVGWKHQNMIFWEVTGTDCKSKLVDSTGNVIGGHNAAED